MQSIFGDTRTMLMADQSGNGGNDNFDRGNIQSLPNTSKTRN